MVSGVYMRVDGDGKLVPCVFRTALVEGGVQMVPYENMPRDDVVEIDGCGAGTLLIHRSVFEELLDEYGFPNPWFAEDTYDSKSYSEDLTFCMRVRKLGHPDLRPQRHRPRAREAHDSLEGPAIAGSIAIWCGQSLAGEWGPWSLDETGIGGSEEAVVRLSRSWSIAAGVVTVYASPGERAGDPRRRRRGATHAKFGAGPTYDVLVVWRSVWFLDVIPRARPDASGTIYPWMHDVEHPDEFTPDAARVP